MLEKTIAMLDAALAKPAPKPRKKAAKKAPKKAAKRDAASFTIADGAGYQARAFKLTASREASEAALDYADRLALRGDHPRFTGPAASTAAASWHRTR